MEFEEGLELTGKAKEKDNEDKAWALYLALRPEMTQETFVPFSEFYRTERMPTDPPKTKEEIMEDVEEIQRLFANSKAVK